MACIRSYAVTLKPLRLGRIVKDDFYIHDPDLCYLDGNSLGRLPKAAEQRVQQVVREGWGTDLIGGWNKDWIHLPRRVGDKIAEVIGASAGEVIVADSTSINLFKLATAALKLQSERYKVLTDATNFPSDLYVLEAACGAAGYAQAVEAVGNPESIETPEDALLGEIDEQTALVCLSQVAFKSGAVWDLERITQAAHEAGAMVLWDLSHSVGAVPIDLKSCQADLAVGCTYKYLCGGPGAPAFLYVREDLQALLSNPIQGWFSHERPFVFSPEYEQADSIDGFAVGTPPILSMAAIEAGVDLVRAAGMESLREQSIALSSELLTLYDEKLSVLGYTLSSPRDAARRGSHVSIAHPEARRITANLIERHQVIPDFRAPDNIRLGIAPLYNDLSDIRRCVQALELSVRNREYETIEISSDPVT